MYQKYNYLIQTRKIYMNKNATDNTIIDIPVKKFLYNKSIKCHKYPIDPSNTQNTISDPDLNKTIKTFSSGKKLQHVFTKQSAWTFKQTCLIQ